MEEKYSEASYPAVSERIKALIADSIILIALMALFNSIFSTMDEVPDQLVMAAFLFVFVLYDPIFTHFAGGTLGHRLNGLAVRKQTDETKKIGLPEAVVRFIIKSLLGWVSFLSMIGSSKRLAIHDQIIKSVVVYRNPPVSETNTES